MKSSGSESQASKSTSTSQKHGLFVSRNDLLKEGQGRFFGVFLKFSVRNRGLALTQKNKHPWGFEARGSAGPLRGLRFRGLGQAGGLTQSRGGPKQGLPLASL